MRDMEIGDISAMAAPDDPGGQDINVDLLSAHLRKLFSAAYTAREREIEADLLADLRQRKGQYDDETASQIASRGGSAVYDNISETKCAAAEAWIADVLLFSSEDRPWGISPTPIPDLDALAMRSALQAVLARVENDPALASLGVGEMQALISQMKSEISAAATQEAATRASAMERKIADQLAEGAWEKAMYDFISDFVTYKCAFLCGPVPRNCEVTRWSDGVPVAEMAVRLCVERVSPFDVFPQPGVTEIPDGYVFVRRRITREQADRMVALPGYDAAKVQEALARPVTLTSDAGASALESELAKLQHQGVDTEVFSDKLELLEFWGSVSQETLGGWQSSLSDVDEGLLHIHAVVLNRVVVKVSRNYDPAGAKPLYKASFRNIPGSFWGRGICDLLRERQKQVNAISRAMMTNTGFASRAQVIVDKDRLMPGETVNAGDPGRVWLTQNNQNSSRPPIEFQQMHLIAPVLLDMRQQLVRMADDDCGVMPYQYGNDNTAGAGRTYSGLATLMNAANRGLKKAIFNIDTSVIKPLIRRYWLWNMLYDPDESIKGDCEVVTKGALSLYVREQEASKVQSLLALTANPVDMQILGLPGRAELLRRAFHAQQLSSDKILPKTEELQTRLDAQQQSEASAQGDAGGEPMPQGPSPVEQAEVSMREREIAIKQAQAETLAARQMMEAQTRASKEQNAARALDLQAEKVAIERAKAVREMMQPRALSYTVNQAAPGTGGGILRR